MSVQVFSLSDVVFLRLAFEILHDIEESVVYIGLFRKLNFNLVQVAQSILYKLTLVM